MRRQHFLLLICIFVIVGAAVATTTSSSSGRLRREEGEEGGENNSNNNSNNEEGSSSSSEGIVETPNSPPPALVPSPNAGREQDAASGCAARSLDDCANPPSEASPYTCSVCPGPDGQRCTTPYECLKGKDSPSLSFCRVSGQGGESECLFAKCSWCGNSVCSPLPSCECVAEEPSAGGETPAMFSWWDGCGVCGGGNASCAGCDGRANSGATIDPCGVCLGDGSSCFHLSKVEYIGIILAIAGNSLISISLNVQKHAHNINERRADKIPYFKMKLWWGGQILMVLGELGNFLAYAYAPATLVAPLGSVTVIANALIAHKVLQEPLFRRNIGGCFLAVFGSILIVLYAPQEQQQLTMELLHSYIVEPVFLLFICLIVAATLVLLFFVPEAVKKRFVTVYVLICSLTGCITVMCTKALSTAVILTMSGSNQFTSVLPWVLVILVGLTIGIQIKYLNQAMISFGSSEVVPVYYVLFTFCSVLGGIILFHEWHEPQGWYTALFLFGCAMTFMGVWLITSVRKEDIEQRRAALLERAGLLDDPDELWNDTDDLDIWGSDDEEMMGSGSNSAEMRVLNTSAL